MTSLKNEKVLYGTREWSTKTVNCCTGCSHDCRYCYARSMAVRFGRVTPEEWKDEKVRQRDVDKAYRYYEGSVMLPSSHDITENNFEACFNVLEKLLKAGNKVLVVSKPHLNCISSICNKLDDYRENILFRFTIGAVDNDVLSFWEPGAPSYEERKQSLEYAFDNGFQTSISVEPMLDSEHIFDLVDDLSPYVTDAIWIGKMNQPRRRIEITDEVVEAAVAKIEAGQTDERIIAIYESLKTNPIIKYKASIKKVVKLELPDRPGLD
jgi:DNA repair photolyase